MVEVTGFNILDSQTLGVLVLIDSSDHICIVDIQSIDVIDCCILDNVGGRRLVWRTSILLYKNYCLICLILHCYLQ